MISKKISICFDARPAYDRFSTELYKSLKELNQNITGGFIVSNKKEKKYIRSHLSDYLLNIDIYEISSYFHEYWDEFTYESFIEYEKKYECAPLWRFIYTDRFLVLHDYNYCIKIVVGYFRFYEEIFSKYDFYYDECISTLQSYIAYIVGIKLGTKYIAQTTARGGIDDQYHYVLDDPYAYIVGFDNSYKKKKYGQNEISKAEKFLSYFEKTDMKPKYMDYNGQLPKFKLKYFLAPMRYIKYRFNRYSNDKYFYMYYQNYKHVLDEEIFYFRYKKSKKFYNKADKTKKYVYFPLHYQPESSTLVCASKYEKQLFFIDSWAKSLPSDTVLYVKEHYTLLGNRELSFYKEIQKYPNVILIDPLEDSRQLILGAVAVTTLTGTAGFEAMLLGKPVIICGNVFYENAPGVIKIDDIFQQYLPIMQNWKKPQRSDIIKYLCEYFRCLQNGCSNCWTEMCYTETNIKLLVKAIYMYMQNTYYENI